MTGEANKCRTCVALSRDIKVLGFVFWELLVEKTDKRLVGVLCG
jgi:hypothetical protein